MTFLFVSDSFKGSLTSAKTAALLTRAATRVFGDCECRALPVADGGEGTVDALLQATGGTKRTLAVHDPLGRPIGASYAVLPKNRAVIEMAAAAGLPLLTATERDPLATSTFGVGELIVDAIEQGFADITVTLGGSATNDGGMGCMRALGVRFLDEAGRELAGVGADLERVATIDSSGLHPRAADARFAVMCDVDSPLCGAQGAAHTFAPQKGASPAVVDRLEAGMCRYREALRRACGTDVSERPGSGAAGGLGAAMMALFDAKQQRGIDAVLDLIDFDRALDGVSLVITGEGRTDSQSCRGKVLSGVGERCKRRGIPAVALSGSLGDGGMAILEHGIASVMTTVSAPQTLDEAMRHAEKAYESAAERMFRLIKVGMQMK
ncbi:MAG: glycerate kinase [Clostridia bacterium]|nr:glycerate kinase [Clostridia bacterium]